MPRKTKAAESPNKLAAISDRVWQGRQSWNREVLEAVGTDRVRYTVRCDAYDFQSYATAEVWHADGWHEVHRIPGQAMCSKISYVARQCPAHVFDADLAELRMVARAILVK